MVHFCTQTPLSFEFYKLCFVNSKGVMSYMFLGQQDPRNTMVMSILCFVQHKIGHGASPVNHSNSLPLLLVFLSTSVHVGPVHLFLQAPLNVILNPLHP